MNAITDVTYGMEWGDPWGLPWSAEFSKSIGNRIIDNCLAGTTYRVELLGTNEDDDSIMKFIIGNVSFTSNDNSQGDGLVDDKLSGKGSWIF